MNKYRMSAPQRMESEEQVGIVTPPGSRSVLPSPEISCSSCLYVEFDVKMEMEGKEKPGSGESIHHHSDRIRPGRRGYAISRSLAQANGH